MTTGAFADGRSTGAPASGGGRPASHYARGVLLAVAAVGFLALSDALAKALADGYDTVAIVFYRAVVGGAFLTATFLRARGMRPGGPLVAAPGLQLLRGLCVLAAAFLFFWGLSHAPLANAVALTASAPLFMALLGRVVLGERASPWIWPLIAMGMAGVVLIVRPLDPFREAAPYLAILGSSLLYAWVSVMTRSMAGRDAPETTALASYLVMIVGAGGAGLATGVGLPAPEHLPFILGLGAAGALGMIVYAHAYVHAGVANLAPWDNVVFLWALLFGVMFFGERPDALALAGGGLIMASGFAVALLRRE
jgi:drug/metabolite transporter (DMT)-like permease